MFRWQLLARTDAIKPLRAQHLLLLTNQVDEIHPELEERLTAWGCCVDIEPLRPVRSPMTGGDAAEALAATTDHVARILAVYWWRRPYKGDVPWNAFETKQPPQPWDPAHTKELAPQTEALYALGVSKQVHVWLRLAEDFIAMHVVSFISYVFVHLWNLLTFGTAALLCMLLAMTAYPFQPQWLLGHFLALVTLSLVIATVRILVKMNRNDLLSRIAKTEPNKTTFDWGLVSKLLLYGALPIVTLVSSLFPQMDWLFSWVDGLLRVFK
jgi:hypothetical protein